MTLTDGNPNPTTPAPTPAGAELVNQPDPANPPAPHVEVRTDEEILAGPGPETKSPGAPAAATTTDAGAESETVVDLTTASNESRLARIEDILERHGLRAAED